MSELDIEKSSKNYYSHVGKASLEKITYLLDRKTKRDKILEGKERERFMKDFLSQEENPDLFYIQNESDYDNDIFSQNYDNKHNSDLIEQQLKYFSNVKNPCTYIENKVKKNITEKNKKINKNKKEEKEEENLEIKEKQEKEDKNVNENKNEDIHKIIAKNELQKIIDSGNNFSYYYHLLRHTYNANYYIENGKNEIILGPDVNATRYNPKLEYIYKKTIYSPSFKLMNGRNDKEKLRELLKNNLYKKMKRKKEENKKKIEKLKENRANKINNQYKTPKFYFKNKEEKKSKLLIYKMYLEEKANSSNTLKDNKSEINENNMKDNYTNNKSGSNNNETIFTSNALRNINNNESNTNNTTNNIVLNNAYLTVRLSNYLNDIKTHRNFRKINLINKDKFPNLFPKKASSVTNIFKNTNRKNISYKLNKTSNSSEINIFPSSLKPINSNRNRNNYKKEKENSFSLKVPDFNKMLGREYLSKLNFQEEPIHPQLNPNFNSVEPKCIMKVIYSHRPVSKKLVNKFKGMGDEATFDINKLFYKYNNHFQIKTFNFNKMIGRTNNQKGSNLPFYMMNLTNRNSCENFNEKSLMMNNYAEGKLKEQISSFNQQKSFNYRLNINAKDLNNSAEIKNNENEAYKIFSKMIGNYANKNKNKKNKIMIPRQDFMSVSYKSGLLSGLPEFYRINLDSIKHINKIDGITYKSYKNLSEGKNILSDEERKLFLVDLNKIKN